MNVNHHSKIIQLDRALMKWKLKSAILYFKRFRDSENKMFRLFFAWQQRVRAENLSAKIFAACAPRTLEHLSFCCTHCTTAKVFIQIVEKLQDSSFSMKPECSITCAYVHIGAQLKVKWRIEIFLCAFLKSDENPLKMLIFQLSWNYKFLTNCLL